MGLNFAMLLGALVGLSVIIPYIGAAVVTVPVALIAYFQWGWSADLACLMVAYGIIQALDGNVLVPLLFLEAVNLHPVAIIVAVLVFGGVWGFWGVFFAIPLATLVKAILNSWPRVEDAVADATTWRRTAGTCVTRGSAARRSALQPLGRREHFVYMPGDLDLAPFVA